LKGVDPTPISVISGLKETEITNNEGQEEETEIEVEPGITVVEKPPPEEG